MPSSIRVVVEIDRAVWISVHFGTGSMSVLFPKCCRAHENLYFVPTLRLVTS